MKEDNLLKKILRTLTAALIMMTLMTTMLSTVNAEAKTKKRRVMVDNNPIITMYVGETIEVYVKNNPENISGWGTSIGDEIKRSFNEKKKSKVTITACEPGLAEVFCWEYGNPVSIYDCHITVKDFGVQNTTVYLGWPTKLDFFGAEVESYSCKKNKYFTLKSDGTIKPKKVTKKPVNVTVTCTDGRQYTYGITVAEKEFTIYEPGEDQWGLLYLHDKEYEYIPELTFYNVNDVETYAECIQEAMRHGTECIHFLDSPEFSTFTTDVDYSGTDRIKWADFFCGMQSSSDAYNDRDPENVICAYRTAPQLVYSLTLKDYISVEERTSSTDPIIMYSADNPSHYEAVYEGAMEVVKKAIAEEGNVKDVIDNICMQLMAMNKHFDVNDDHYCHEACGLFMTGDTVCSGYADALSLCLTILGLDNGLVQSIDCGHAFNAVWLDGQWLYYDLSCFTGAKLGVPYEYYVPHIKQGEEGITPNTLAPIVNGPYIYDLE